MTAEAGREDERRLAEILFGIGITGPGHPALVDRVSLGRYLVSLNPPEGRGTAGSIERWREKRRVLSQAGVEKLREAIRACPPPPPKAEVPRPSPQGGALAGSPEARSAPAASGPLKSVPPSVEAPRGPDPVGRTAGVSPVAPRAQVTPDEPTEPVEPVTPADESVPLEDVLASIRDRAAPDLVGVIGRMCELAAESRFIESFRAGSELFAERCEEALVDACICVSRMASRWDREERVAPYSLYDNFEELAAAFGKHVREMRHIDPDPLRATSGLYRLATKIYRAWVDHCAAILEHQHKRTNTSWIQVEWVQPHRFNCLLNVMRSAVRIKLPLDLLLRIYQHLRQTMAIGKSAIALDSRKVKFEGDCLRVLASPSKDVIPDLCYIIYRDIIDTYVEAGENAAALMFCDQALLIRRGDHEVEQIKADIIAKSGRKDAIHTRSSAGQRTPFPDSGFRG